MMRSITAKLRFAEVILGLIMAGTKMYADFKRHSGHEEHAQTCRCMANCTGCVRDSLLGK